MEGEWAWSAGLMANYSFKPLVVVSCPVADCAEDDPFRNEIPVVENLVTADLLASLTPIDPLQIGLRVPISYAKGQGITEQGDPDPEGIDAVGLGDIELDAKFRLLGDPRSPFVGAIGIFGTAPLGTATAEGSYIGSATPTGGLRGIVDVNLGDFFAAANLSGLFAGTGRIGETNVGSAFLYSAGAGYRFSPLVALAADAFGSTRFTSDASENNLEIVGAFKIFPAGDSIIITLGGGGGVLKGTGVPAGRGFLGLIYSAEKRDRDGDQISDGDDDCPTEPEDRDGFRDEDGCPDKDNDEDTIEDTVDKCPDEAEDPDGFEDVDGCPETDNDKDGVIDTADACPAEPETKNGYKDDDGCPDEKDTDNDGVPDAEDKCPNEAEDTDGFEDTDGCPDPDNDGDGVEDSLDECADELETKNGYKDEDGCPDEAPDED
jgi:hypothetical protein